MAANICHQRKGLRRGMLDRDRMREEGAEMPATSTRRPRLRRAAVCLCAVALLAAFGFGFYQASIYVEAALASLDAVPVAVWAPEPEAGAWWTDDVTHVKALTERWPLSIPSLLAEALLLWHQQSVRTAAHLVHADAGYTILPADGARDHYLLEAAIHSRLRAAVRRWDAAERLNALAAFRGYSVVRGQAVLPVDPAEVQRILAEVEVPVNVLGGFRIVLLPFGLDGTAGLGTEGELMLGAAPTDTGVSMQHRTAYTLLHELGHHVHYKYLDDSPRSRHLWQAYMELRGIREWVPSGKVGTAAWQSSARETFAEDFRVLFGPEEARFIPHGTKYGDPRALPDGGAAIREFILSLFAPADAEP